MQYGILAYLTARASMFPFFGWEWDEGRSQRAKHTTSCTFTDVPHRTNTGSFQIVGNTSSIVRRVTIYLPVSSTFRSSA